MAINLPAGYDLGPAIRKQGVGDALNAMVGGMERGQRIGQGFVNTELAIRDQMEQEKAARRKEAIDEAALLEAAAWEAGTQDIGGPGHLLRTRGSRRSSGGTTGGYSQALSAGAPIGISRAEAAEAMALQQQAAIEQDAVNRAAMMGERSRLQEALDDARIDWDNAEGRHVAGVAGSQFPGALDEGEVMAALNALKQDAGAAPVGPEYVVKEGDSLSAIARELGIPLEELSALNRGLTHPEQASEGRLAGEPRIHPGETGERRKLLVGENLLYPGEKLALPGAPTDPSPVAAAVGSPAAGGSRPVSELQAAIGAYDKSIEALPQPKPVSKNPFHTRFGKNKLPDPKAVASAVRLASKGDYGMINEIAGRPVKKSELEGLYSDYEGYIVDVETFGRAKVVSDREKKLIEEEAKVQKDNESKRETLMTGITLSLGEGGRSGLTEEQIGDLAGGIADTWLLDKALGSAQLSNLLKMGTEDRATAALIAKKSRASRRKSTAELQGLYPGLNVKYYDAARAADAALDTWLGQLNTLEERRTGGADPEAIKLLQLGVDAAYNNYTRVRDDFKDVSGRAHKAKTDEEKATLRVKRIEEMAKAIKSGKVTPEAVKSRAIDRYGSAEGSSIAAAAAEMAKETSEATSGGGTKTPPLGDGARGGEPEAPQDSPNGLDKRIRELRGEGIGLGAFSQKGRLGQAFDAAFTDKHRPLALLERDLEDLLRERKTPQLRDSPGLEKRIEDKVAEIEAWYASSEGRELKDIYKAQRLLRTQ